MKISQKGINAIRNAFQAQNVSNIEERTNQVVSEIQKSQLVSHPLAKMDRSKYEVFQGNHLVGSVINRKISTGIQTAEVLFNDGRNCIVELLSFEQK
jgi:hypothetical protein